MSLPIFRHYLTVSDTEVLPSGPLDCGTAGDHNAAELIFEPLDPQSSYRVEIMTAGGAYDLTELLTPTNGEIAVSVPCAWTTAGVATVRLVEVEERDGEETARRYFPPVTLRFGYREEGGQETALLCWQQLVTRAEAVLLEVSDRTAAAERAAAAAAPYALAAETAAARCEDALAAIETLTDITAAMKKVVGV